MSIESDIVAIASPVFNTANGGGTGNKILSAGYTPKRGRSTCRVYIAADAAVKLQVEATRNGVTVTFDLFDSDPLVANAGRGDAFTMDSATTYNFIISGAATILYFAAEELLGGKV